MGLIGIVGFVLALSTIAILVVRTGAVYDAYLKEDSAEACNNEIAA